MGSGFQLVFQGAEGPVVRKFDQDRVVLGRSMVCDAVVDSPHLSRKHAEIVREGGEWIVQDLHSRQGLAVNGRPVVRQKLTDGDRILLAPDAAEPTLLEFHLAAAPGQPLTAVLSDDSGPSSVIASINLRELSTSLDQYGRTKRAKIDLHPDNAIGKILAAPDTSNGLLFEDTSQLPLLSLFKSAGELLLARETLDEMLQGIVNLVAQHLPGRRGVVCMVDPGSGEIEPRWYSREQRAGSREQGAGSWELGGGMAESGRIKDEDQYKIGSPGAGVGGSLSPRPRAGHPRSGSASPRLPVPNPQSLVPDVREGPPAAQPFVISRSILQEAVRVQRAMLVASVSDDPRFHGAQSICEMGIRSAVCVPLYHQGRVNGVIYVDSQRDGRPLDSRDLEVLSVLGLMVAAGMAQISLRGEVARERMMRDRLARYNSPQVVEQIMKAAPWQEDEMLAEEHDVSVLFADITGFTTLAEAWSPAEAVQVLNLVFERWTSDVFEYGGTLDKYIGDAVMAIFGAPLRQADHARRAVATALAMQRTLAALNRSRPQEPPLALRVGINSGPVIAGDIGSRLRKAYTAIGDAVNIASRLESTVALPGQIIIGQATYEQVREDYSCDRLGEFQLRGRRQSICAYRLVGKRTT